MFNKFDSIMKAIKFYSFILLFFGLLSIKTSCTKKTKQAYTCVTYIGNSNTVWSTNVVYDCNSCPPSYEQYPVKCVPIE